MQSTRFKFGLRAVVMLAVSAVAIGAQAMGVDIQAVVAAHPDLFGGIAAAGLVGETIDVKAVNAELGKMSDQIKEWGEKAVAEAKKGRDIPDQLKSDLDAALTTQSELKATLQSVEQAVAALKKDGPSGVSQKSTGHEMIEDAKFKAWASSEGGKKGASFSFSTKAISSGAGSAGVMIRPDLLPGIMMNPDRKLAIRDLVAPGRTGSNLVGYFKENVFTNNAGMVPELGLKPESDITFTEAESSVKKIAHFMKASSEILSDFPQLQSIVDTRLRWGLDLVEDVQLLTGSGVGNNLYGIMPQATAYQAPLVVEGATRIDVLRLMLLQAELALYPSDGIVLNPVDWTAIELMKDSQGRYLLGNPQGALNNSLWGRRVVETVAMSANVALVGAFKMGAQIFDRELANVTVATENEDDFVKNRVTILAEKRLAFAVYRPQAFIKNTALQPAA